MGARTHARAVTYGLSPQADLWADAIVVSPEGTRLVAHRADEAAALWLPLIGRHHAYTALAAAAAGLAMGLSWDEIRAGLAGVAPLPGRTRLLHGVNGASLLDDSYNASPASALAALETLRDLPAARRVVALGDMAQLGSEAEAAHRALGRALAQGADLLVTVGELAHLAADEALTAGMAPDHVHVTYTHEDAQRLLTAMLRPGDVVLIKGSAEARLESLTAGLLAEPERALTLLPRQGRGWQQVQLQHPGRPTWVEVDLEAIAHNVRRVAERVGPEVAVLAVLKADGYGHGAIKVARTALNNGARWLGVACLGEAITLRQAGIQAPMLNLGYTPAWQARGALLHDVASTIFGLETAQALSRAALDLGRVARVHVKVDTGMGRLGLLPDEVLPLVRQARALPALQVEGLYTHFSSADEADLDYTHWQMEAFERVLDALRAEGLLPPLVHAANSAAILRLPASHYTMVRLGIALYGLAPSLHAPCPPDFRPALSFKCQVAQVKELPVGSFVGYGRAFRAARPTRIAVIPVGYADGFRRGPSNWGTVLVRGQRAPLVGRVCMDQTMIDVTDIPGVRAGDEVVLIGRQGTDEITVDEVARQLGTINYEVVSEILARVPRVV
jgi:alanine racemase